MSDGYGIYRKWLGLRQACLAHLIREARGLSQRRDKEIAAFGSWAMKELQALCHMAHEKPSIGQWRALRQADPAHHPKPGQRGQCRPVCPKAPRRARLPVGVPHERGSGSHQQLRGADAALRRAVAQTIPRNTKPQRGSLGGAHSIPSPDLPAAIPIHLSYARRCPPCILSWSRSRSQLDRSALKPFIPRDRLRIKNAWSVLIAEEA